MNNCKKNETRGETCEERGDCAMRHKLWAVGLSMGLSLPLCMLGLLGRSEALVAAGLYAFYQGFLCGKSVLNSAGENLPGGELQCNFVSIVAAFIVSLGALDVLIFSIWRLTKASLLTAPTPWALLAAAIAILINYQLSQHSGCVARQPGGGQMEDLRGSFQTSMLISGLAFAGVLIGQWWPPIDALAAIIGVGLLARPIMGLVTNTNPKTAEQGKKPSPAMAV
ncbi:MAG: hypothetical protein Q7R35_13625 [Elusimicrobiota bacterium]|nr:hypothetical protein [Elusimicrobiota bacterium]